MRILRPRPRPRASSERRPAAEPAAKLVRPLPRLRWYVAL